MEREGIERAGVQTLMSGARGMAFEAGKRKILRKEDGAKRGGKS